MNIVPQDSQSVAPQLDRPKFKYGANFEFRGKTGAEKLSHARALRQEGSFVDSFADIFSIDNNEPLTLLIKVAAVEDYPFPGQSGVRVWLELTGQNGPPIDEFLDWFGSAIATYPESVGRAS
ncbi:MAG: hypothetical protein SNJ57_18145 [Cyanobacteriota bacterium]